MLLLGVAITRQGLKVAAQASQMLVLASNLLHRRRKCCFWHQIHCTGVANAAQPLCCAGAGGKGGGGVDEEGG